MGGLQQSGEHGVESFGWVRWPRPRGVAADGVGVQWPRRRCALSAALASRITVWKNRGDWPLNSWSAVRPLIAAIAPAFLSSVGRTIETSGSPGMNFAGSGRIRLVWVASPPDAFRSGK